MASQIDHTQPQYPGDDVREDNFYHLEHDNEIPRNGIYKKWACGDPGVTIVTTSYDTLECEAQQMTEGWFAAKCEAYREAYKDLRCAMFVTSVLAHKLVKEAIGPDLADESCQNPIYFKGSMSTHLLTGHVHNIYEKMADVAQPFATAMEMTWNAVKMYKAAPTIQTVVGNEMNYRLYVYACSLAEGRPGHKLDARRRGLFIKEWVRREVEDKQQRDRYVSSQVDLLYRNHLDSLSPPRPI